MSSTTASHDLPGTFPARRSDERLLDERAAPLQQQHVPPHAVLPAEPVAPPDHAEPGLGMQGEAGDVLREDSTLERPDAGPLGGLDERPEQCDTDAAALRPRV